MVCTHVHLAHALKLTCSLCGASKGGEGTPSRVGYSDGDVITSSTAQIIYGIAVSAWWELFTSSSLRIADSSSSCHVC